MDKEYCPKCGSLTAPRLQAGETRNFHIESCEGNTQFYVVFRRKGLAPIFNIGQVFVDKHGGLQLFKDKQHAIDAVKKHGYGRFFECEPA